MTTLDDPQDRDGRFARIDLARRYGWQAIAAATSIVIAVAAIRGVASGYEPIGDNALIELRGRDVFTSNHPWLGTWSSASISSGIDVNHPGPLIFDLVALPVRLFGGAAGIAFAVATLHIVIVWLIGFVTNRAGGATAAITAQVVTVGLVWTLGSELLYDPWQPNVLILPFWLVMCTVWAIAAGQVGLFPLACAAGSFAMQTHLGYIFIVPILLGFAAVSVIVPRWRHAGSASRPDHDDPAHHQPDRDEHERSDIHDQVVDHEAAGGRGERLGDLRRPALLSIGVIVVLWAQPLYEQFFGPGRGNLGRVVTAGTGGGDEARVESTSTGLSVGIRVLGSVLALPPWWGRQGYDDSIPPSVWVDTPDGRVLSAPGLRTTTPSLIGLLVLVALIGAAWYAVRRRGVRHVEATLWTLSVALVIATVTVIVTPIDILGLTPHKVRWLWVIGAFATFALLMAALAAMSPARRVVALSVLGIVGAVGLVASLPTHANRSGPVYFEASYESVTDLREQLDDYLAANDIGPVLFDAEGIGFAEPYTAPVMAELLEAGIDLVVADRSLARQLGPAREADQIDPTDGGTRSLVYVRAGQQADEIPDGATRIAFHDGDRSPYTTNDVTDRAVAVFLVGG